MNLRVVKLGGSLFDLPDLGRRVEAWLAQQAPQPTALLAGGGMFADAVRQFDAVHQLPSLFSHHLALQSMRQSARALSCLLPAHDYIGQLDQLRFCLASASEGNLPPRYVGVWDVVDYWLQEIEPTLRAKTLDWTLTSDSIAAKLAVSWNAKSLVMLKSCDPPGETPHAWSAAGAVDPQFAEIAAGLTVSWVNLRDAKFDDRA
ncbi:hypothetical protein LOC68_27880 [Blastopirellula sp. JC732]|uniref:Aspartate/glutamate/uridylate kinase domain-containing protein n=1 Tax=Blastopirellula sediminis TaxID=2894196 RepID=A0A9X1SJP3_9BACT|nr:hypothetical protein [Blastopirellula sediminis]MCC9604470.1 hypothetical protein [Blastopirellula sediminis]MCC9632231.1 hypothetical protein [Blastopirellula sediminis]